MNNSGVQANFYLGIVKEHKENFQITADIPGVALDIEAFPLRGDCDEPKPGDPIILLGLDPEYNSYFLYWKLKENDFTGFRAYGKEISIEEGKLVIRAYDGENSEDGNKEPGTEKSRIELDDSGNITASNKSGAKIEIKEDGEINTASPNEKSRITLKNDGNIEISTLGGTLALKGAGKIDFGTILANGIPSGFIATPNFLPPGSPIPTTSSITFIGG